MIHYSTTTINRIYEQCLIKPSFADRPASVSVPGFMSGTHTFNIEKLRKEGYPVLLSVMKDMPREMRRSISDAGVPWAYIARDAEGIYWMSFHTAERLACMGIALELITRLPPSSPYITDMDYIIIEDLRIQKKEAVNPSCKRNKRRREWK